MTDPQQGQPRDHRQPGELGQPGQPSEPGQPSDTRKSALAWLAAGVCLLVLSFAGYFGRTMLFEHDEGGSGRFLITAVSWTLLMGGAGLAARGIAMLLPGSRT